MSDQTLRDAVESFIPEFYKAVKDFPDLQIDAPLSAQEIAELERKLEFSFDPELAQFFQITSGLVMNGLKIKASELGTILLPQSDALILGYFYLKSPADRLMMLPADPSVYYLEQHNGAITKIAGSVKEFFDYTLTRYL